MHYKNYNYVFSQFVTFLQGKLRLALLKECHDGPVAGHRGVKPTLAELVKNYYWPNLRDDVEQYVKSCGLASKIEPSFVKRPDC